MLKCLHCQGEWEPGESTNSRDLELEEKLQELARVSSLTGICGFDYITCQRVEGAADKSQQRHVDREVPPDGHNRDVRQIQLP